MAKDDTAEAKFVLLDWIAWPVIGVKAEKILNGSLDEVISSVYHLIGVHEFLSFSLNIYFYVCLFPIG